MARVTVEDCVEKIPNRFNLVMTAAQRARNIASGSELTLERDNDKNPVVALREIAEERVDFKELEDALITGLQRYVEVEEPEEDELDMQAIQQEISAEAEGRSAESKPSVKVAPAAPAAPAPVEVEAAPEVAAEATPEVAAEATPEVAAEAAPEVAAEATPEVAAEAAPEVAAEAAATPQATPETTPETTQGTYEDADIPQEEGEPEGT